jgi:hypothetical protein
MELRMGRGKSEKRTVISKDRALNGGAKKGVAMDERI